MNRYYAFKVCPAFWDWLVLQHGLGNVLSIEAVRRELEDPDAKDWAKEHAAFFERDDDSLLGRVSECVYGHDQYQLYAQQHFLSKADPLVIAFALQCKGTVVTHEVSAPGSQKSVKIPDVCKALSVECVNTFVVLHELGARFILEKGA